MVLAGMKKIRLDINYLRAFAVVIVVLYHFKVPFFGNGYLGVDIFFVISGFLMTQIIMNNNASLSSVLEFYFKRLRRISIPLIVVIALVCMIGFIILTPTEYRYISKGVASSPVYLSNFIYNLEPSYFYKPERNFLLHTWSLSVEWQFYFLYPLILLSIRKKNWNVLICISLLFLFSMTSFAYTASFDQTSAFYLLNNRAWQMLLGGIVYLLVDIKRIERKRISATVLVVILLSLLLFYDSGSGTVGVLNILVSFIIASLLYLNVKLVDIVGLRQLGLWSYSIYLYHWPIYAVFYALNIHGPEALLIMLLLSTVCGWASYTYIEKNSQRVLFTKKSVAIILSTSIVCSILGCFIFYNGALFRGNEDYQNFYNERKKLSGQLASVSNSIRCFEASGLPKPFCNFSSSGMVISDNPIGEIVLIGDSHAQQLLDYVINKESESVISFSGYAACVTSLHIGKKNNCGIFNNNVIDKTLKSNSTRVYVSNSWIGYDEQGGNSRFSFGSYGVGESAYRDSVVETMCEISKTKELYIFLPLPVWQKDVSASYEQQVFHNKKVTVQSQTIPQFRQRSTDSINLLRRIERECRANLIDLTPMLCPKGLCSSIIDNRPFYTDKSHLSVFAKRHLISNLNKNN